MLHSGTSTEQRVRLAAVGDILRGMPTSDSRRASPWLGNDITDLFESCDLVFGNLECTLACDQQLIPTEPRCVTDAMSIRSVKAAGFDVVSLANNHTFDGLDGGFRELRSLLDELHLPWFGAGMDLAEAAAPAILESGGLRLAFVGAVDQRSGPYQFASEETWGVASLDIDRLTSQIRELRREVNHVIVSVHWGEERFLVPSPQQLGQARSLVDAGASMVLGHHPHVLQGLEVYRGAPIIYSLGNFLADEVCFSSGDAIRWNRLERTGCILLAELSANSVRIVRQVPTFDDGSSVKIDETGFGQRRIRKTARAIAGGVSPGRYRREHFWVKTVRPTLDHLRPSQLRHLRPRHFRNALRMVMRSQHPE